MKEGALRVEASPGRVLRVIVTAELRQHLRDPLTLVFMVLVPLVLYPALGGVGHLVVSRAQASADARVLDVATEPAIDLPANLRAVSADPEASVRDGSADIGVRRIGDQVDLWWDSRSPDSIDARGRVVEALTAARKASAERQVRAEDTDPPERRTRESAARFLPALLLFTMLTGGLYTALDLITGEKERGSVETLLSTAVDRRLVLFAKFLVVLGFTVVSTVLSLASSWVSAQWVLGLALPPTTILLSLALFAPMAVLLAAVLVAAAAWAPDFKSGQVLTTPLLILPLVMAAATFVPGLTLTPFTAVLTIAGLALATREVVAGRIDGFPLAVAFLSTCGWAAAALAGGARLLGREDVILGTRGSAQRRLRGDFRADALGLLAVAFLALWFIGQTAQAADVVWGTFLTQLALFVPLALLAPWWVGLPVRSTLRWGPASATDWARGALLGLCLPGVGLTVQALQGLVLHSPSSLFEGVFPADSPLWLLVFAFGVLPGVCEELLFRGAFFGLWRTRAGPVVAVMGTAVAFGAFHLSVFRFFPTAALGLVLGLFSLRTGRVGPGMLAHALNNSVAMVALSYGLDVGFSWPMVVLGAAGVALAVPWRRGVAAV